MQPAVDHLLTLHENIIQAPTINMVEALIMSEMEKLLRLVAEKEVVEDLTKDVKLITSLMREKRVEGGSGRLKYWMYDVIESARDVQHRIQVEGVESVLDELRTIGAMLRLTKEQLTGAGSRDYDVGEGDVVGLEKTVEWFLGYIMNRRGLREQPCIACIGGAIGSGKTTFARQLYGHADVARNFECRIWVNCGEFLSQRELVINVMKQLLPGGGDPESVERRHRRTLQKLLNQQMLHKEFFVVLDDVPRHSRDYFLKSPRDGDRAKGGSILLLTCRVTSVPYNVNCHHNMKPLDPDESWQLALKIMCSKSSNDEFPRILERRGKRMLMKHTGGLPLAIKEAAMEWQEKRQCGNKWEEIVESNDIKLRATLEALDLGFYRHLKPDDKSRFLHLGLFKLGETIRTRRLVQTMVASGVLGVLKQELENRNCLNFLVRQRIIEMKDITKGTKANDLISNLDAYHTSIMKAKYVCVNPIFHKLSIIHVEKGIDGASHRMVNCNREMFNGSMDTSERLICLSFNGGGCFDASPSYWKCFKQLKVLEFEDFGLKILPGIVGDLIELKYLGLRNNHIQELPHSLGNLKSLEVLDIVHNFMVKVPDILWEMDSLIHLYMSDISCVKPLKIEALKKLRTLTYISVDNWAYEVSGLLTMTNLRKLGVKDLDSNSDISKLIASLAMLEKLECLVLRGYRFQSMPSLDDLGVLCQLSELKLDGLITKLPRLENFPPNLIYLTLVNSCFSDDPMPVLEELPSLEYLKLRNAYIGQEMVISVGGFPNLRHLCIEQLGNLRTIQVTQGALRLLQKLEITGCPYLWSLPKTMVDKYNLKLNMVTTKKIATRFNKLGNTNMDIQP